MREALDDSELYLNDDEDTVYIKRRNREPAPKVIKFKAISESLLLTELVSGPRSQVGKVHVWADQGSALHDELGSRCVKEDITATTFPEFLFKQLSLVGRRRADLF